MHIVILRHPPFFGSVSMPRFARMIEDGMRRRGHEVEALEPVPRFHRLPCPTATKKWLGYLDQFFWFPCEMRRRLANLGPDAIVVVPDQALGMWVPLIAERAHVIHCHDFLALRSARGEFPENRTRWTGRHYQRLIHRGFSEGKNFISVSEQTRKDLHRFVEDPKISEVVYNGLAQEFGPATARDARARVGKAFDMDLGEGYLLHVGGNQWYKNRRGVIELYSAWRKKRPGHSLPLLMIGARPTEKLQAFAKAQPHAADIRFAVGVKDDGLRAAYSGAAAFLFPSLEEGFGWPIAEAMASGTPVLTTDHAPMSEVAGEAAWYLRRRAAGGDPAWAEEGAAILAQCLSEEPSARQGRIELGFQQAARFCADTALDGYEAIYQRALAGHSA